jgi:hypothetical protein
MTDTATTWTAISAIAEICTAIVAVFVLREAQRIRRVEWLAKSHEMWQVFNNAVITHGYSDRIEELRSANSPLSRIDSRDRYFIFMYMNVLHVEFEALRRRLIDEDYGVETMVDSFLWFKGIKSEVAVFMRDGGYDDGFTDMFERVCECAGRSDMADLVLERARRETPSWWLR